MITELKLVETMYEGLYLSITFCVIALTIATMNIVQAIWSALTIGLIIVNTMGLVAYMGWELGSAESVGVVVCVGFAVDYVVHLAAHFVHSKAKDRNGKIRESLREIGISILSGSVTTIGATGTLFICTLMIFHKFAMLVIWTIILSTFYSLAFFSAICHTFGPMGNFGNIAILYQYMKKCI
jgi:predicted RND superfamily exporter protein